jgi:hypothetical protein
MGIGPPPEVPVPPEPIIEVDSGDPVTPHVLTLGAWAVGDEASGTVTITNLGDGTLDLDAIEFDDEAWTVDASTLPMRLGLFQEATLTITFRPVRDGPVLRSFTVLSNDPEHPRIGVRLVGTGGAPSISVEPGSYDFGRHPVGCSGEAEITISNVGSRPLEVTDVRLDGLPMGMEVELPGPFSLDPSGQTTVSFLWRILSMGDLRTTLHIESNDPQYPEVAVPLVAGGLPYVPVVDGFEQGGVTIGDVLFVVDNSCSMGEEQASMAANFPVFVDIVELVGLDYRLGVVTTDSPLLQGPPVESSYINPAGSFGAQTTVGTLGSGYERALDMAWEALNFGLNPDFLREGATLDIVVVSDEMNQSFTFGSATAWAAALQSLRPDPSMVTVSNISGGDVGCFGAGGVADPEPLYVQLAALTDGVSGLICDSDWSTTLEALAWNTTGLRRVFELSETPVGGTIEVRWNGAPIAGWTYDSGSNSVNFSNESVPGAGWIEVRYATPQDCWD